ncbi:unnamed protein product [Triticum turgidum subsp. durum]|uniref:non-specific serine/threonine protein kinase n=1 Tax=Triticum turgidum subsp. durum TaxID=4567 RepID=A0A9R0Z1P5_TRITD|nr:unnamed protein product [Triticum turgidum subsp. durum]
MPPQAQSVVWFAKESAMGTTPNATARSVLSIPADGQLKLTDGSIELWRAPTPSMKRGSVLVLTDSGNVQLLGDGDNVLWESFGFPTDTLLPGQSLEGFLFSKRADTEFTTGRFSLAAQSDGNVVLCIDLFTGDILQNAYWATATNGPYGNTTITFDEYGHLSYTLHDGSINNLISPLATGRNYVRFARMDPDGIVRAYARPKHGGVGGQNTTWCGEENISDKFSLVELPNTIWELSIYYKKFPSVSEEQCHDYCLNDCFCAAALMINGSDCVELGALVYGRQGNEVTTKALIKVRKGNNTSYRQTPPSKTMTILVGPYKIVTICLALLLVISLGGSLMALYYLTRNRDSQRLLSSSVRSFSCKELYQATNGFKKLLGKGSFGEVYKGMIRSPQPYLIAVKKLIDSNEYCEQEFTNEVQSIGQIHHRNLVRMIGYCKQGKHRMLVFEFMPGGSLRGFLFNPERRPPWRWRAEAALAIARGLKYLHDGCIAPIIHCDIKPDNILLDDYGIPKITDFGISKLLGSQQVHTTVTHVRGTRGYIAHEWLRGDARVDTKADVYSFGVVLLEMICCRRCQEPVTPVMPQGQGMEINETVTLFGWAAQLVVARRTELMLHGDADVNTAEDMERVERFTRVALWCIEPNPLLRPTIHQVVQILETNDGVKVQALPDPPDCYMESSPLIPQLRME